MRAIAPKYPDDAEVQTLCADAIMNTMPWDYWQPDGTAKPQTAEAKKLLESVMQKFPQHPGANHLYVHLVEASPTPELGLKSANVLASGNAWSRTYRHMPAHIYVRVGDYASSIDANTKAVKVDEEYLSFSENQGMYRMMYYPHNVDLHQFQFLHGRAK
jgi:hypothetical protein